jgi:hypothetical protein
MHITHTHTHTQKIQATDIKTRDTKKKKLFEKKTEFKIC